MGNKVSFIIQLQNRFSRQADKIKAGARKMVGGFNKLDRQIKKTSIKLARLGKEAKKAGGKLASLGKSLVTSVSAPAAAFTANAIRLFNTQEQALAKVRTGLASTGGTAKLTFKELTDAASQLQEKTLFGDEEILSGATSTLLTFTNIAGKVFKETQVAVLDLSARMGIDLQSAAVQLGKALNDPVANLSALSRSGIQFTDRQKAMIKGMVQVGRLTGAQKIILKELNTQFGGTAEAMARVGAGPLKQLSNSFGDLNEEIGKAQFEVLRPFIESLKQLTKWMSNLSPKTKAIVGAFVLFLSVLGPIVFIIGQAIVAFGALTFISGALGISFSAMILPVLSVIAAVGLLITAGVLIINNWNDIKAGAKLLWRDVSTSVDNMVKSLGGLKFSIIAIGVAVAGMFSPILAVVAAVGLVATAGVLIINNWEDIKDGAKLLWRDVSGFFSNLWNDIKDGAKLLLRDVIGTFSSLWSGIKTGAISLVESFSSLFDGIITSAVSFGSDFVDVFLLPITTITNKISDLGDKISSALSFDGSGIIPDIPGIDSISDKISSVGTQIASLFSFDKVSKASIELTTKITNVSPEINPILKFSNTIPKITPIIAEINAALNFSNTMPKITPIISPEINFSFIDSVSNKISAVGKDIASLFSFSETEIQVNQSMTQKSQTDININLRAPAGIIESVKSKTFGNRSGLNTGINMVATQ